MHAGHELDRFRPENARATKLPEVEQHSRKTGQIRRGAEQSGVARHSAHVSRRGIMDRTAQRFTVHHLRGRDSRQLVGWRQIPAVFHFQWTINFALDEFLKRCLAHALHDLAEQEEIDVTVPEGCARGALEFRLAGLLDRRLLTVPIAFGFNIRTQPGRVGQKLADSDGLFAITLEFRNVSLDRLIELHVSTLDYQH